MARLTNEHLHSEIKLVKNDMAHLKDGQSQIQEDLTMIKKQLLGPDDGAIARINKNTEFVIEASSCQIAYSKFFKSNNAMILNISPDH